jgi:hypothetical protein
MNRLVFLLCVLVQSSALAQRDPLDSIARSLRDMQADNAIARSDQAVKEIYDQRQARYYYNAAVNLQQQLAQAGQQVLAAQAVAKDAQRDSARMAASVRKLEAEVLQLKKELKKEKGVFDNLILDIANRLKNGDTDGLSSFLRDIHDMVNKKKDLDISVSVSKKKASQ